MNEAYEELVTTFPPEKSPKGEAVLLKFQTRSGEVLRLRVSGVIARQLGTLMLRGDSKNYFPQHDRGGSRLIAVIHSPLVYDRSRSHYHCLD